MYIYVVLLCFGNNIHPFRLCAYLFSAIHPTPTPSCSGFVFLEPLHPSIDPFIHLFGHLSIHVVCVLLSSGHPTRADQMSHGHLGMLSPGTQGGASHTFAAPNVSHRVQMWRRVRAQLEGQFTFC